MNIKSLCRNFIVLLALSVFSVIHLSVGVSAESIIEYPQDMEALAGIVGESIEADDELTFDESVSESDDSIDDFTGDSMSGNPADDSSDPIDDSKDPVDPDSDPIADDSEAEKLPDDSSTDSIVGNQPSDMTTAEEAIENARSMEGLYFLLPFGSEQKMMSVKGNAAADMTNIQLGSAVSSNVRIFEILKTDDGYYNIRNINTGKFLTEYENNVVQKELGSGDEQKWILSYDQDGSYKILTKDKERYITAGVEPEDINIYTSEAGYGVQKWNLTSTKLCVTGGTVSYTYASEVVARSDHSVNVPDVKVELYNKILKEGIDYTKNVELGSGTGTIVVTGIGEYTGQRQLTFKIADHLINEGLYLIKKSGTKSSVFAISGNSKTDSAQIVMGTYALSNVRNFRFRKAEAGYYYIQNLYSGKYLTANSTAENASLVQKTLNRSNAQKWRLEKKDGLFYIELKGSNLVLTAVNDMKGTQIRLNKKGKGIQQWELYASKIYIVGAMAQYAYDKEVSYNTSKAEFNKPSVKVFINGSEIKRDRDYQISYSLDIAKGKGTVILNGIGNYAGKAELGYTLKVKTSVVPSSTNSARYLSGKKFIIHPASDSNSCIRGKGSYIRNGTALYSDSNTYSVMSVFKFVAFADDFKILGSNVNYSVFAGSGGKEAASMYKQNDKNYQRWNLIRYNDGKWSVVNKTSGYAWTLKDGQVMLLPYCSHVSQKFVLEDVTNRDAVGTLPEVRSSVDTFIADGQYVWNFTLEDTNSVLYLTKERYHHSIKPSSGIMCDMKNRKLGILRAYVLFDRTLPICDKPVDFGDIIPKAGERYSLILKQEDTATISAILKEVSTGKTVSTTRSYGAGFAWGKINTYVDGSVSGTSIRAYSLKPSACDLVIVGDSYTEGGSLTVNYKQRYATLVREALSGETAIVARGGATSTDGLNWLNQYILDIYQPKYMILAFGMNDTNYSKWLANMQKMIEILKKNGITPILATIPPSASHSSAFNAEHHKMSEWVRKSGYHYLDFEYYMTKNHDRVTPNPSAYLKDQVHPTIEIHKTIKNKFIREMAGILS